MGEPPDPDLDPVNADGQAKLEPVLAWAVPVCLPGGKVGTWGREVSDIIRTWDVQRWYSIQSCLSVKFVRW